MALLTFMLIIFFSLINSVSYALLDSLSPLESISNDKTLVSKEGNFEFGFFSSGSSSRNCYLGICYKKIPGQTIIWVLNICNLVNGSSGLLTIKDIGFLVWSTSFLKEAKKLKGMLLDSGNLIVTDEEYTNQENYLWQSFDYPSDTLLLGMKFGWDLRTGLNRRLSAWTGKDDPCSSNLTWGIEFHGKLHTTLRKGTIELHRSGPRNGISFGSDLGPTQLYSFDSFYNGEEVYFTYNPKDKSVVLRIVMDFTTTSCDQLIWIEREERWKTYSPLVSDSCDKYGLCGANGYCDLQAIPVCQCLKGFKPRSPEQWDSMDWSQGCVREHPVSCQMNKQNQGFVKFSGLKLPNAKNYWANQSMDLNECRDKCLSNCSCTTYTNSHIRGQDSGCTLWFGDIDQQLEDCHTDHRSPHEPPQHE